MSTLKCCRETSFGCFWVRFSGIDGGTCQEAHCVIKWKSYAWVPQITVHFLNCLQNYTQGDNWKNYSRGRAKSLKMSTQSLNYFYKHFSLFFSVFLIPSPLAAQCPLCTLSSLSMRLIIASYNDSNVSSHEVKKAAPQSFALVGWHKYLIRNEYVPQEVAISPTFWEFYDFIYGSFGFSFILTTETCFVAFH